MQIKVEGTLKNAIMLAAADAAAGETIKLGMGQIKKPLAICRYYLATVKLPDGRMAQAQLCITTQMRDFIRDTESLAIIELSETEVCDA